MDDEQTNSNAELPELPDVPFLELSEGRLQGVVSSESQAERVYASSISAGDHGLSCCSNDDLRCGGLGESQPAGTSRPCWPRRSASSGPSGSPDT